MRWDEYQSGGGKPPKSDGAFRVPGWVALHPVSVVAVGGLEQPVDRLLALQSAIAKAVHMATMLGRLRLSLPLDGLLRLRLRRTRS